MFLFIRNSTRKERLMKLYFSPGACSLSPHIVLREAGLPFQTERVDLATHQLADGRNLTTINPKGYVPVLELDDGNVLTEGPAIVQYIADLAPDTKLAPPAGTLERYRVMEWLNFITSEIHKSFAPLFNPNASSELKDGVRASLVRRFDYLAWQLADRPFLMGDTFTVADAYLFTVLGWCKWTNVDLSKWPTLLAYLDRIATRPAVREAMNAEGLVKE
jgi:glutathione S-transferase